MDSKLADIDEPNIRTLLSNSGGYNQTYIILKNSIDSMEYKGVDSNTSVDAGGGSKLSDGNEVFFRCGNWCYKGRIQFNGLNINTADLPILIPALQKQQGSLRYYCNANSIPIKSDYYDPVKYINNAADFVGQEMSSDSVDKELRKMSSVFPWIDDDSATTYFELGLNTAPKYMDKVALVATKTYVFGLILISVYYDGTMYFVIQNGEGDQPLLDVRFPDISKHGQGFHIASYNSPGSLYKKLTLWHILFPHVTVTVKDLPKLKTLNVASSNYEQTYCIMKSSWDPNTPNLSVHHDVLFRFGSWCYSGRVQLTPALSLSDIPFVIPALRMQQSRLDFICDVNNIPTTSPFAGALEYIKNISPHIESQIVASEGTLNELVDRLSKMGLGESVSKWLEGDPNNSFFEFKVHVDERTSEAFKAMELVATKSYHASGIITVTIIFEHTVYVCVLDGSNENPLLDSRFPDISGKGRGYQIQAYTGGIEGWANLRKVSIWQTVSALEQEFRDRATQLSNTHASCKAEVDESVTDVKDLDKSIDSIAVNEIYENTTPAVAEEKISDTRATSMNTYASDTRATSMNTYASDTRATSMNTYVGFNSPEKTGFESNNSMFSDTRSKSRPTSQLIQSDLKEITSNARDDIHMSEKSVSPVSNYRLVSSTPMEPAYSLSGNDPLSGPSRRPALKGHHLPKLENQSLAKKMEDIRNSMTNSNEKDAPWDSFGRPKGLDGSKGEK